MRKRRVLLTLLLIVAAAGVTGITGATVSANPLAVLTIPATSLAWIDSGVDVQVGMAYPISAGGTVFTVPPSFSPPSNSPGEGRGGESGPEGQIYSCYVTQCPLYGVGYGALVGRIGTAGKPFYLGAGPGFSLPGVSSNGGRLYLAINDWYPGVDPRSVKSGAYTVRIGSPVANVVVPVYEANGPLSQNLIVNGDAEAAPGGDDTSVVGAPGWTTTGNFTVVDYALGEAAEGTIGPSSNGPSARGANFFSGGPDSGISTATQAIALSAYQLQIATGAKFQLSGWLGGWDNQDDNATLTATFKDSNGATLSATTIGPVLAADRLNTRGLLYREASGSVPVAAASVMITLTMTRVPPGVFDDGYADNLTFALTR